MKKIFVAVLLVIFFLFGCCFKQDERHKIQPQFVQSKQQIISNIEDSTVALQTIDSQGSMFTYCAGVWISQHKIITAKHCVEAVTENKPITNAEIEFRTKNELNISEYPVKDSIFPIHKSNVIFVDNSSDIAILLVKDDLTHFTVEINKLHIFNGQKVHVIGHTAGMLYTYSPGTISQLRIFNEPDKTYKLIQIVGFISIGNSGGGAFDEAGRLIGICSFIKRSAPNMSFFVSYESINEVIQYNRIKLD